MISWLRVAFLLVLLIQAAPVRADEPLHVILQGIRKHYGSLPGLSLTYERGIITKSMAMLGAGMKSDFATGKIYFKTPHFLRIEQEKPTAESVITDGDTMWWYVPAKREVYQYKSSKLGHELRLLGDIFQGLRGVEESFMVALTSEEEGRYRLELSPQPAWPEVSHILVTVAQENYRITVVEIYNYIGGITRFTLGPPARQDKFEKGFFQFSAPEGVSVIEE